jgi:magnesium transporter
MSHLGELYQFDTLILEDILNTEHRPKFEELENYIFLTIKSLSLDKETMTVNSEQISLLTGANYLISFQENHNPLFNSIIDRIKLARGKIRYKQEDYLMYTLLDVVVDNYFEIIETIGENLEDLEDEIYANPGKDSLQKIQLNKKALLTLQKIIFPLRDEIGSLLKSECKQINPNNRKYFRDVYDHLFHMGDSIENLLEINSSVKDIYLSNLSFKMNQIIQTLTIFTAIFTPLTFLAGLYGMNFQYMPELSWRYGYFVLLGFMAISAAGLIIYLRRKKWL